MNYKIISHSVLLLLSAVGMAYLLFAKEYFYAGILLVSIIFFLIQLIRQQLFLQKQFQEFSEAVKYRDFTRRYSTKNKTKSEKELFSYFNQINVVFKEISSEKEIQHQYLSEIINMLDAAILFYHADSGKVELINDAFKNLFETPHLGNISGLAKRNPDLYEKTLKLKIGSQQLETAFSNKGKIKLLIQLSEFETQNSIYRIVVYQNINKAVDETENKAWHKLLRVLTHEIMNSIAPISSLAETLNERLQHQEETEALKDFKTGISTIKNRSEGLLQFAKSYRLINKVDQPNFKELSVAQLFEGIFQLLGPSLLQKGIELDIILKNTRLKVVADKHLLEQVLINLTLNAMDALENTENPTIKLVSLEKDDEIWIQVVDNGTGMEPELIEQIFTPFFTTKKAGNGIGLTLSKQIMLVHNGNITVESESKSGTTVNLKLPNYFFFTRSTR
ncbi:MAG TPA: ATP-binding protein [Flavobacteriaceae bacterium]|nr:ATP-binding protein [Flavobacteriaceae bacterium]